MLPDDRSPAPPPDPPDRSEPAPPAEINAVDPENRDTIFASIAELEEQAWRRREAAEALPPPPPPPTQRWSVAISLAVLAVVVWVMPLITRRPVLLVTTLPRTTTPERVERGLQSAADRIEQYRVSQRHLPGSLALVAPVSPQIHYFPDTGARFILETPITSGVARLTVERSRSDFQVFGPNDLRPAPPRAPGRP
ncbi:MAG: hypothetical protein ACREL2_06305 [Gemmatimonadales bacterium]